MRRIFACGTVVIGVLQTQICVLQLLASSRCRQTYIVVVIVPFLIIAINLTADRTNNSCWITLSTLLILAIFVFVIRIIRHWKWSSESNSLSTTTQKHTTGIARWSSIGAGIVCVSQHRRVSKLATHRIEHCRHCHLSEHPHVFVVYFVIIVFVVVRRMIAHNFWFCIIIIIIIIIIIRGVIAHDLRVRIMLIFNLGYCTITIVMIIAGVAIIIFNLRDCAIIVVGSNSASLSPSLSFSHDLSHSIGHRLSHSIGQNPSRSICWNIMVIYFRYGAIVV
mmetsp:Transcript_35353/g.85551  ORF Transcript_35353/g.85551 Transcript_35353/m.85551 type:complete len:278 (-) Transcript_35353:1901-2734(-)